GRSTNPAAMFGAVDAELDWAAVGALQPASHTIATSTTQALENSRRPFGTMNTPSLCSEDIARLLKPHSMTP
ncbi:MAG: hypothetical protein Q8R91_03295, partial [Candidatus Omnitrophota bacterium]|nr:hypothetical protein [Candidatus Omnitrophota bacterium]